MIKREDFNGKTYEEMASAMQADLVLYSEEVSAMNQEQCEAAEQELMVLMDEVQAKLANVTYELPAGVDYENKHYAKSTVTSKIVYFLNKIEVKWEHTLGLYQLVQMWKREDFDHIAYNAYDSTLRSLNTVTFKGFSEWEDILIVNAYLSKCHNEYSLDTGELVYLHERHNIVMNRMKELNPGLNIPEELTEPA
jgi:hypothetical protein